MDRRRFVGTLLAALGATTIDPKALLWSPLPEATTVVDSGAILTLNQITMQMLKEIVRITGYSVPFEPSAAKVGHSIRGAIANRQFNVGMIAPEQVDRYGLDYERYIKPLARAFAVRLKNLKGCGELALPDIAVRSCVVRDHESGLALRGIQHYVLEDGLDQLRFDMLVAQ
jgi:hypothetical protein